MVVINLLIWFLVYACMTITKADDTKYPTKATELLLRKKTLVSVNLQQMSATYV